MKTKPTKLGILVSSLALMAVATPGFAAAAAVTGSAAANAGASASAAAGANRALPSAAAGGSANAAAQGAIPRGPVDRPVSNLGQSNDRGRPDATGLDNAMDRASEQGRTHGLTVAAAASGQLSASLAPDDTVKAIRGANFAERAKLTTDVDARVAASEKLVDELEADAKTADSKSRAAIAKSLTEVRKQQKQVRAALKDAAKASGDNWGKIQSELAKEYGDLAKAVSEAEVAAKVSIAADAPKS